MPRSLCATVALRLALVVSVTAVLPLPTHAQQGMSSDAKKYVQQLLNKLRELTINRDNVDWKQLESKAMAAAPTAQTIPETFPAIKAALNELKDRRAGYRAATGELLTADMQDCAPPAPSTPPTLPSTIGYLRIVPEPAANVRVMSDIATRIQTLIREKDTEGATGWIVDLRGFRNGSFPPAVIGVGPLLGDGTAYSMVFSNGSEQPYVAGESKITMDGQIVQLAIPKFTLVHKKPTVAVLIGPATAGSGEVVAIAFIGRKDARTFGTATCGLPPYVSPVNAMSDGAKLYVNPVVVADRNRKRYFSPIEPDEKILTPDELIAAAVKWLGQPN